ncbi:MAG: pantoate--beta-alanine ligase [Bacteroidales bacterium]
MIVVKHISALKQIVARYKNEGKIIGFVPTMGALHKGHLSLVERAKKDSDVVVVSIFVNPTQFNDKTDYEKYPRLVEQDIRLLENEGKCDVVFLPSEAEMYPEPDKRHFDLGYLETIMEGKFRPGHFQGVAQIVSKLFEAVEPHKAFFGKKDFQQVAVIRRLVEIMNYPIEIISCDIVRESNGLAMSSRNLRLSSDDFHRAQVIYQTLSKIPMWLHIKTIDEIKQLVKDNIEAVSPFKLEYIELVDTHTLKLVTNLNEHKSITACVAVYCNDVRLIDNIEILL